jgi:IS4 transposase
LADVKVLDLLVVEPGAYYVMDRGYLDFRRLYQLKQAGGHFITRAKRGFQFIRHASRSIDKQLGLRSDQVGRLAIPASFRDYPDKLRRVRFHDAETDRVITFLTDQFSLPALTICQLYKQRWQVEMFFKWIKQHLRIRKVLWHVRQCRQDPGLDCHLRLRLGGDLEEAAENSAQFAQHAPSTQCESVRKSPDFSTTCGPL